MPREESFEAARAAEAGFDRSELWDILQITESFRAKSDPAATALLRELSRNRQMRFIGDGQSVTIDGDQNRNAFAVVSGGLKVCKTLTDGRTQAVDFLLPGDFCWWPWVNPEPFSIEAFASAEVCVMFHASLAAIAQRNPDVWSALLRLAGQDLARAHDYAVMLGRKTAIERVASFLLVLDRRQEQRGDRSNIVKLPMGRDDIADHLGLTVETVSRQFTRLKSDDIIALPVPTLCRIVDRPELERLAHFDEDQRAA